MRETRQKCVEKGVLHTSGGLGESGFGRGGASKASGGLGESGFGRGGASSASGGLGESGFGRGGASVALGRYPRVEWKPVTLFAGADS